MAQLSDNVQFATELNTGIPIHYNQRFYSKYIKRSIDLLLSLIGITFTLPIMLILALVVAVDSPGPIFYRGVRSSRFGKTFRIFKFRSMVVNAENIGGDTTALADPRITRVGAFMRKAKLDEIPQLFNVFKGDMSFIGPRPELPRYTEQYDDTEKIIMTVRPGITDLSSIEFISLDEIVGSDNAVEMYEKIVLKRKNQLRIKYAEELSFWLDARIFFTTVWMVIEKMFPVKTLKKSKEYQNWNIPF